jgi:hypothetical protein
MNQLLKTVKAPWRVVRTNRADPQNYGMARKGEGLGIVGSDNRRVAYGTSRAQMLWLDASNERSWVEAHLTAAAPEMLAALKLAQQHINRDDNPKLAALISAIIAKAETPQPMVVNGSKGVDLVTRRRELKNKLYQDRDTLHALSAWDRISDEECHKQIAEIEQLSEKLTRDEEAHQNQIKAYRARLGFVPAFFQPGRRQAGWDQKPTQSKPKFTPLQGDILAFIHAYTVAHGISPSEADIAKASDKEWWQITRSLRVMKSKGLIERPLGPPGKKAPARNIIVLVHPAHLPPVTFT